MSSQQNAFVPTFAGETRSQAVARRLRGQLAERSITGSELARRLQMSQPNVSQRLSGKVSIPLDEIDEIEAVTGIDATYLLTGLKRQTPPTGGGADDVSLHTESNRRPFHYWDPKPLGPRRLHLVPPMDSAA